MGQGHHNVSHAVKNKKAQAAGTKTDAETTSGTESVSEAGLASNLNVHASVFQSGNPTAGDSGMPYGFK